MSLTASLNARHHGRAINLSGKATKGAKMAVCQVLLTWVKERHLGKKEERVEMQTIMQ